MSGDTIFAVTSSVNPRCPALLFTTEHRASKYCAFVKRWRRRKGAPLDGDPALQRKTIDEVRLMLRLQTAAKKQYEKALFYEYIEEITALT